MPMIDLAFQLVGSTIPLDHGYALFAALCRIIPELHGNRRLGVHPIRGRQVAPGVLALVDGSRLRLRIPSEEIAPYLAVAGRELVLGDHRVRVGIPRVESLIPAASLAARLVTFKNALTPESSIEHMRGALAGLAIDAAPQLVLASQGPRTGQPLRRVLRVKDKRIVGYAVRVQGLTAEASITLQEHGLGGRRRMGCGVFVPVEKPVA